MILQGIPISEEQCIGDSLQFINNAFTTLSTFVILSGGGGGGGGGGGTVFAEVEKRWAYTPGDPFGISYTGIADIGSNPNQNVWTVTRIVYRPNGDIVATGKARNIAWNNRALPSVTYS